MKSINEFEKELTKSLKRFNGEVNLISVTNWHDENLGSVFQVSLISCEGVFHFTFSLEDKDKPETISVIMNRITYVRT